VSHYYRLFGSDVVCNVAIPGLVPVLSSEIDFHITLGSSPVQREHQRSLEKLLFTSSILAETGSPALQVFADAGATMIHVRYSDGMEFWLDEKQKHIWGTWPDSLTLSDAATYLLGPVFGLFWGQMGRPCLHASAVNCDGRATLFAGEAGAGKSTTAAAMARRGCAVLSDDIVAIIERNGAFWAVPAYPYLSLWPETVEMLYGAGTQLPAFSAKFSKQMLSLGRGSYEFQDLPLAIHTVFILCSRNSNPRAPYSENMSAQEGLLALVANSYSASVLESNQRAKEFEFFGRMVKSVRVERLHPSSDPALLDKLCDVIVNSRDELGNSSLASS
jgi:hypothetical protein